MDGHAVSPFDLSQTLPVSDGLLVPYSLPTPPTVKQFVNRLLESLARVGGFSQCASAKNIIIQGANNRVINSK